MTDERNLGARAAIARLVDAKRNGDRDAINDAILSLGRVAEGVFRAKIERELRATRELSRGYSVACDESCDLLNEALWRVYQKAETFRGASDEQALAWWDDCIAAHKAAGIPYLVMSWSQPLETKAQMSTTAAYLDAVGAKCRAAGLRFGYHCHSHEFRKVDGATMIDTFLAGTKPENLFIQMDVYWAVMGGASPVEYFNKYPGRFELLHIKDKYELGQSGMVGFDAIFKAFPRAGTKAFVVELEQASTPNILKGLRESALYLRKANF